MYANISSSSSFGSFLQENVFKSLTQFHFYYKLHLPRSQAPNELRISSSHPVGSCDCQTHMHTHGGQEPCEDRACVSSANTVPGPWALQWFLLNKIEWIPILQVSKQNQMRYDLPKLTQRKRLSNALNLALLNFEAHFSFHTTFHITHLYGSIYFLNGVIVILIECKRYIWNTKTS